MVNQPCPPHHYMIDRDNIGRCKKCGLVTDFSVQLERYDKSPYLIARGRKGGKKNKGR